MLELFRKLPIDQILRSPYQARKDFDREGLISLSESMRQEGLQNPITVRLSLCSDANCQTPLLDPMEGFPSCPEGSHWHGELVAGERRLRAAGILGWPVIDAKVIQTVSEAEAKAKGMIENLQRKDLNPIEEAEDIQGMLDLKDSYWTQEQIGKVIGKSKSHISETLRLLDLPENIKEKFRRRNFSAEHGAELLRLPTPELQQEVAKQIEDKSLTRDQTRAVVNKLLKHDKAKAKKTGRPSSDFMAPVWPGLEANTDIHACGYWDVAFKKNKWVITMNKQAIGSKEEFASWFTQVGAAMIGVVPAPPLSPRQSVSRGPAASTPLDSGLKPAGMTTLSDEEEQIKAAEENAIKLRARGMGGFNK